MSQSTLVTDLGLSAMLDTVRAQCASLTVLDLSGCLQMTDAIAKKIAANFPALTVS